MTTILQTFKERMLFISYNSLFSSLLFGCSKINKLKFTLLFELNSTHDLQISHGLLFSDVHKIALENSFANIFLPIPSSLIHIQDMRPKDELSYLVLNPIVL